MIILLSLTLCLHAGSKFGSDDEVSIPRDVDSGSERSVSKLDDTNSIRKKDIIHFDDKEYSLSEIMSADNHDLRQKMIDEYQKHLVGDDLKVQTMIKEVLSKEFLTMTQYFSDKKYESIDEDLLNALIFWKEVSKEDNAFSSKLIGFAKSFKKDEDESSVLDESESPEFGAFAESGSVEPIPSRSRESVDEDASSEFSRLAPLVREGELDSSQASDSVQKSKPTFSEAKTDIHEAVLNEEGILDLSGMKTTPLEEIFKTKLIPLPIEFIPNLLKDGLYYYLHKGTKYFIFRKDKLKDLIQLSDYATHAIFTMHYVEAIKNNIIVRRNGIITLNFTELVKAYSNENASLKDKVKLSIKMTRLHEADMAKLPKLNQKGILDLSYVKPTPIHAIIQKMTLSEQDIQQLLRDGMIYCVKNNLVHLLMHKDRLRKRVRLDCESNYVLFTMNFRKVKDLLFKGSNTSPSKRTLDLDIFFQYFYTHSILQDSVISIETMKLVSDLPYFFYLEDMVITKADAFFDKVRNKEKFKKKLFENGYCNSLNKDINFFTSCFSKKMIEDLIELPNKASHVVFEMNYQAALNCELVVFDEYTDIDGLNVKKYAFNLRKFIELYGEFFRYKFFELYVKFQKCEFFELSNRFQLCKYELEKFELEKSKLEKVELEKKIELKKSELENFELEKSKLENFELEKSKLLKSELEKSELKKIVRMQMINLFDDESSTEQKESVEEEPAFLEVTKDKDITSSELSELDRRNSPSFEPVIDTGYDVRKSSQQGKAEGKGLGKSSQEQGKAEGTRFAVRVNDSKGKGSGKSSQEQGKASGKGSGKSSQEQDKAEGTRFAVRVNDFKGKGSGKSSQEQGKASGKGSGKSSQEQDKAEGTRFAVRVNDFKGKGSGKSRQKGEMFEVESNVARSTADTDQNWRGNSSNQRHRPTIKPSNKR